MMKLLHQKLLQLTLCIAFFMMANASWGQSIWSNPIDDSAPSSSNPYTTGDVKDANITVTGIGRGSGVASNAGSGRYNLTGWTTAAAIDVNDYFSFKLTPNSGYKINFTSLVFTLQRSSTGPTTYVIKSSLDSFAAAIQTLTVSSTSASSQTFTLTGASYQNVTSAIEYRVYGYSAGGAAGTASVNDFVFNGTVVTAAVAPTITSSLTDTSVYNTSDTYTITASGSPTSYSATPLPTGATISSNVITFSTAVAAGTYNITIKAINATGNDTETLVYTRTKANQTITFLPDPIPSKTVGDAPFNLSSTASSGATVSYASSNLSVATVSGNTVTVVGAGSTSITASQSGNTNYNAATNVSRTLNVVPAPVLSVTPVSISLDAIENQGPSVASQLTNITGANMVPASGSLSISVTQGATSFEVSNVSNSGFGSTASFSYSSAAFNINNPAIFVRLKSGLAVGNYTGTVTITGGGATTTFVLSGEVESAPSITLTNVTPSGPFCNAVANTVAVSFTTQGTFGGYFTVQHSDAAGNFPENNFQNIIGAGNSPITATLPSGLAAGNYKVRVINNASVNTFSNANADAIVINANPTLTGVNTSTVCSGENASITLNGLLANAAFTVNYTINGGSVQEALGVTSDASGNAAFEVAVTSTNNGQQLVVTGLTRTDVTPSCVKAFSIPVALSVNQKPTVTGVTASSVCEGQDTVVTLTGLLSGTTSDVSYTINGGSSTIVSVTADGSGTAAFNLSLTASNNGQILDITSITNTNNTPNCSALISGVNTVLNINSRPTAAISTTNTNLCLGNTAQISIVLTGVQPWSVTYTDGTTPVTVNNITVSPYVATIEPSQTVTYTVTNVNDANCTAMPVDITGSAVITVNANTWTGALDTDWNNAGNWSCGTVPTEITPATITLAPLNQPKVSGAVIAKAKKLTIESTATLVVVSGSTLSIQDDIDVTAGGLLTVENNANLLQVNNTVNHGLATVHKNGSALFRSDYTLWSSPVAGQNLLDFSPITLPTRFYTYTPTTDTYSVVAAPQSTTFDLAKGYLIRMPNAGSDLYNTGAETWAFDGVFTGTPNNGNIVLSLSTDAQGYNAIGNPYPSAINFVDFIDANTTNIDGQIWLWRKTNGSGNTSYATMTKAAYTKNDGPGGGVDNDMIDPDTYELNVGQGFIVKSNTGNLTFNNAMRGNSHDNPFFRTTTTTGQKSRYWLNLTSTNGGFSQIAVAYRDDATLNYDNGLDGRCFITTGNTSLYSFADGINLAIQARPQFTAADIVPLGFQLTTAGEYTFSIDNFDGLFASQDIFIKDKLTNTVQNLKQGSYTFTATAGTFDNRFEIIYTNTILSAPVIDANNFIVYKDHNELKINGGKIEIAEVTIYDTRGRLVYNKSGINATQTIINNLELEQQVLIIQITTSENLKVSKKIIY